MASWNVTVEDSSPLITYSPANVWIDGTGRQAAPYSGSSFRTTSAQGAAASFDFNGTGVWLFGARNSTYGDYIISVDGQVVSQGNAGSSTAQFQTALGGTSGLPMGKHTVVLTNSGSGVDLDSVVFQTQAGSSGATVTPVKIDDGDGKISYSPSSDTWNVAQNPSHFGNTLHFSDIGGAQASYTFTGEAVAIYGTVSSDHGAMEVSIDGRKQDVTASSEGARVLHAQTLVYYTDNLGPGLHSMVITGNPSLSGSTGKFVDIDAIEAYTISGGEGSVPSPTLDNSGGSASGFSTGTATPISPAQKDNSTTAHRKTNMAGIVGGAVGGAIVLISLLLLLFFLLKRRKARQTIRNFPKTPMTPALPIQFSGKSPVDEEKGRFTGATAANLAPGSAPYGKLFPVNLSAPHSREGSTASFSGQSGISQISSAPLIAARRSLSERRPSVDAPTLSMPRPPPASMGNGTPSRVGELQRNVSSPGDRQALRSRTSVDYPMPIRTMVSTPELRIGNNTSGVLLNRNKSATPSRPSRPPSLQLSPMEAVPQLPTKFPPNLDMQDRPSRPSRPSSPHLSVIEQPLPPRKAPRDTIGIVDLYTGTAI